MALLLYRLLKSKLRKILVLMSQNLKEPRQQTHFKTCNLGLLYIHIVQIFFHNFIRVVYIFLIVSENRNHSYNYSSYLVQIISNLFIYLKKCLAT